MVFPLVQFCVALPHLVSCSFLTDLVSYSFLKYLVWKGSFRPSIIFSFFWNFVLTWTQLNLLFLGAGGKCNIFITQLLVYFIVETRVRILRTFFLQKVYTYFFFISFWQSIKLNKNIDFLWELIKYQIKKTINAFSLAIPSLLCAWTVYMCATCKPATLLRKLWTSMFTGISSFISIVTYCHNI